MKTATKARLLEFRSELEREEEGAQTEREHGDPETYLEADEPEVERDHPDSTPDGDGFA